MTTRTVFVSIPAKGGNRGFFFSGASPDPARAEGPFGRAGDIDSVFVIADPTKLERADRLLEKAERACLISRSVSCTVTMEPRVVAAAATPGLTGRAPCPPL